MKLSTVKATATTTVAFLGLLLPLTSLPGDNVATPSDSVWAHPSASVTAPPSAPPSGGATPTAGASAPAPMAGPPSPTPTPTLSPAIDRAGLLREFTRAQKAAIAGLKHQNSMELKTLDSAQTAVYKEWWAKETDKRRHFFSEHSAGKDKRAYVQDMEARRKTFLQIQRDERSRRAQEQKARLEAEQEAQSRNLKDFNDALKADQVPPARLWPESRPGQ